MLTISLCRVFVGGYLSDYNHWANTQGDEKGKVLVLPRTNIGQAHSGLPRGSSTF